MAEQVRVQLELSEEEAVAERAAVGAAPGSRVESEQPLALTADRGLVEARFIEPISMVITCTLATLAVRMVNHWLKRDERGVQIDLRTDPATISHLEHVPAGVMMVIGKDGTPTIHREHYDAPEEVLPVLREFFA